MVLPLTDLTEQERAQAMERFDMLRPVLEGREDLAPIADQHQMSLRTLQRWLRRYHTDGFAGLSRKRRTDRGKHYRLPSELHQLIEGLALQNPPLTVAIIHRRICELARQNGLKLPSYGLVYNIINQLPLGLTTLAHRGTKAYQQRFDLLHRREADGCNAIWQADHCVLDVLLVREGQAPAKPWLTVVLDDYSRAMAGYFLTFDAPSALNTSLALRQAIWRKDDARWHVCGVPSVLYTDCGSDFISDHVKQVGIDLKMILTNSIPGQPRGRGRIERFFLTVQQMLLCELPGYAPPKQGVRDEPRLTLDNLERRFRDFILDVYHVQPHSETHIAPQQRWEAGGFLPQMPDSLEQLDLLLLTVAKPRKVRRDGIWFLGMRYLDTTLAAYVGESVIIRYDPRDVAEIRVFYHERFLCRAICQDLAGATVPLRDIMKARNRHRRDLRQFLQDRAQVVESLLSAHRGHPSTAETVAPSETSGADTTLPPKPQPSKLKRYLHE
jgi:putative transposase